MSLTLEYLAGYLAYLRSFLWYYSPHLTVLVLSYYSLLRHFRAKRSEIRLCATAG